MNSFLKRSRTWASATGRRLFRHFEYTVRSGVARGLVRRGGFGFIPRPRSAEEQFLQSLRLTRSTVFDVGGYEGLFAIAFARTVGPNGRVVVFEPNPLNCERIRENVMLNGFLNVEVRPMALGSITGRSTLVFPELEPARGSLWSEYQTSLRRQYGTRTVEVEVDSMDNQVFKHGLPSPDFVKIDVEAAEVGVLEGMCGCLDAFAPELFVEVHSGVDLERLIQILIDHRYDIHHIESGSRITIENCETACPGHIHCVASHRPIARNASS